VGVGVGGGVISENQGIFIPENQGIFIPENQGIFIPEYLTLETQEVLKGKDSTGTKAFKEHTLNNQHV
jgi:hypothetical protein